MNAKDSIAMVRVVFDHTDHVKPTEMVETARKKVTARGMLHPQQTARSTCSLSCTTEGERYVSTT
jgi:hypothetical protein